MAAPYPPQAVTCPNPQACKVAKTLKALQPFTLAAGTRLYRVYDGTWGYDEHNPGLGDTRFAPIDDPVTKKRLPNMYLAETPTAALLEAVFHDVHEAGSRVIDERHLTQKLLAHVEVPIDATLGDLRDPQLSVLGLQRDHVVSSPAEHYPCTRQLAILALTQGHKPSLQGLIWHSRQAELAGKPAAEVIVLFGERYPAQRGQWTRIGPGSENLYQGPGRDLVDSLANDLKAVIETNKP